MDAQAITLIVFLLLMFGMFYLMIIRPQRRRQQEHQNLVSSLNTGDKVITIGGIYGIIDSMTEDSVVLKIESGATVRMSKASIAYRQEQLAGTTE